MHTFHVIRSTKLFTGAANRDGSFGAHHCAVGDCIQFAVGGDGQCRFVGDSLSVRLLFSGASQSCLRWKHDALLFTAKRSLAAESSRP